MKLLKSKLASIVVSLSIMLCVSLCLISRATAETHQADNVPWSGYWWPSIHGGLATGKDYRGHPAPLEKYDQLVQGTYPGLTTNWYTVKYYDTGALSWFGLCWNWAQAATYENIEFFPSSENNILFRVGDKKGILTAANTDNYVESENGASPAVFHYWLLNYIQDQGKAFVADLDPSGELWSYPVYRFESTSSSRSGSEAVTVTIYYADDMVAPDYMGTQIRKKTYTYTLSVAGQGTITGGQWTGDSIKDHPQGLTFVLEAASDTPYLDYDRAVQIARSADDFLEGDDRMPTPIVPGTYNLVLMNEDAYKIDCQAGDSVSLSIKRLAGSSEDMLVSVRDSAGAKIDDYRISAYKHTDSEPYHLTIPGGAPPYTLTIGQDSYLDPNVYVLTMDVDKAFQQQVPYIPSFMWSGFAVTNPADRPVSRVFLTSYDNDGEPVHTGFGPITLKPGEKRVFLLDQLPWRKHEFGMIDRVMLKGDGFLNFVNLFGDSSGQSMSSFTRPLPQDDRIILPGAVTPPRKGQKVFAQILNPSGEDADVMLKLFSAGGAFIKQVNTTIAAGNKLSIQPGRAPFHYSMSNTDWIEVSNSSGRLMSGFQTVSDSGTAEVVAMPEVTSTRKIIPHIPPISGNWNLVTAMINPNDVENHIRLHMTKAGEDPGDDIVLTLGPREKRMIDVQSYFTKPAGDHLYHSMVEITSDLPFVGWYSYNSPDGGDEASFPLIDEMDHGTELILPHNAGAGGGTWWTGACVGNSSKMPVTVMVEPYDVAGRLMHDKTGTLSLDPGAYEILTVASYFGPLNSDISFLKFRVDASQEGSICGFYLYGKLENGLPTTLQLSGGNLGGAGSLVSDMMPSGTQLVKNDGRQGGAWGFSDPAAF